MIENTRVPMIQSTSGSACLWEPRHRRPRTRFFPCLLTAAGVFLALALSAQADCPLPTVNAGPNQYLVASPTNTIQLAGAVGNGATSWSWSGGLGTFNPNAQATNAVYTPSAAERAAGSWALTLTASSPCGSVSNSMSFFFVPTATLPLVTSQSPEGTTIGMDISVLLVPYGWQSSTASNLNSGYVTVAILYTNGAPTAVSLQDYNFSATGPGNYSWEWWDALGGFFINGSGTASSQVTFDSAPGPQNPFYPVYGNIHNQVTFTNVPFGTSGTLAYTNAEYLLFTSSGTIDMSGSGVDSTNANPATVFVTNGVIWLQMPFTSWGSNGTPFLFRLVGRNDVHLERSGRCDRAGSRGGAARPGLEQRGRYRRLEHQRRQLECRHHGLEQQRAGQRHLHQHRGRHGHPDHAHHRRLARFQTRATPSRAAPWPCRARVPSRTTPTQPLPARSSRAS